MCTVVLEKDTFFPQLVLRYLSQEHREKRREEPFLHAKWTEKYPANICKQPNSFDCGVFLCYYARMVCEGEPISESIDWLPNARHHMTKEIIQCSLESFPLPVSILAAV